MIIREAVGPDFDALWPIIQSVVVTGDTYGFNPGLSKDDAYHIWMTSPQQTWLAEVGGEILGTYYIKPNMAGPGQHVCNCGYMVASSARGQGIATTLCEHSMRQALALNYSAMQFNFVASTNTGAVRLWQKLGFEIVGTLPKAFQHPDQGFVDAFVMYQWLSD